MGGVDWTITLALIGLFAGLAAAFGWLGARPPNLARGPRLIPYRFLMLLCAFGLIVMAAHAVNLAGIKTGRPGY
jgi:hypothetical protein